VFVARVASLFGHGDSPCCELIDDARGRLTHKRWGHARRASRRDKLVDADEIALTLERLAFDSLHKDVRALAVLGVRAATSFRRCLYASTQIQDTLAAFRLGKFGDDVEGSRQREHAFEFVPQCGAMDPCLTYSESMYQLRYNQIDSWLAGSYRSRR